MTFKLVTVELAVSGLFGRDSFVSLVVSLKGGRYCQSGFYCCFGRFIFISFHCVFNLHLTVDISVLLLFCTYFFRVYLSSSFSALLSFSHTVKSSDLCIKKEPDYNNVIVDSSLGFFFLLAFNKRVRKRGESSLIAGNIPITDQRKQYKNC